MPLHPTVNPNDRLNFAVMNDGTKGLLLSHEHAIERCAFFSGNGQLLFDQMSAGSNLMPKDLPGIHGLILVRAKTSSGWVLKSFVL